MRALLGLLYLGDSILPSLHQDFQLSIELSDLLTLSHSADDNAAILWFDAVNELFESGAFFTAFNFRRDRNFITEWHEYQVSARE
ncbi:Uncharacterised protein [Segatella copri]|nr:Uncharacterised protein [Segatella copri]